MRRPTVAALVVVFASSALGQVRSPSPAVTGLPAPAAMPSLGLSSNFAGVLPDVPTPYPETLSPIDFTSVAVRRLGTSWQVWVGGKVFRDCGDSEPSAQGVATALRDLRPTDWGTVGGPRPVVEYAVVQGKASPNTGHPKNMLVIDLATLRVEAIKGMWCVRDDDSLLFNCGADKPTAEQVVGVARKYGFNRVGVLGSPAPVMSYLFASPGLSRPAPKDAYSAAKFVMQVDAMTRTGIAVPGVGFVGESVKIDPRKVGAWRDGAEWVVGHGTDVFGRFGYGEWPARDAAKMLQDLRVTDACHVGSPGVGFFLANGKAPTRVPLAAQGKPFDPTALKVQQIADKWVVTEAGRPLWEVADAADGEVVIRVVRQYGFDQLCEIGGVRGVRFLAKSH